MKRFSRSTAFQHFVTTAIAAFLGGVNVHGANMQPMWPIASLQAAFPYRARFLIPWLLYRFSSAPGRNPFLESTGVRFVLTFLPLLGCLWLLPRFVPVIVPGFDPRRLVLPFLVLFVLHYCAVLVAFNHRYDFFTPQWCVYDMPAILFYLIAFLLLTASSQQARILGYGLALLFSLNRETIVLAPMQAIAVEWTRERKRIIPLLALVLAIAGGHVIAVRLLGGQATDVAQNAIAANLKTLRESPRTVLLLGGGILFWLPFLFPRLTREERLVVLASLPFLGALCGAGVLVEPRIFNELVPLNALLAARALEWADRRISTVPASG
jgi:hypothetical protein